MKTRTKLSELFQVRISRGMRNALLNAARRLRVRPADIARMAFAKAIAEASGVAKPKDVEAVGRENE